MRVSYPDLTELQVLIGDKGIAVLLDDATRLIPDDSEDYTITSDCETVDGEAALVTVKYLKQDGVMTAVEYDIELVTEEL